MKTRSGNKRLKTSNNGALKIEELLKLVVEKGASDLHLTVPSSPVLRVDGVLIPQTDIHPLSPDDVEAIFNQVASAEQKEAFEGEHELDAAFSLTGIGRFRVNAMK
ncbi:MAG: hypothetical protein KAI14_02845, partial [Dehalococcoidales bacterium]|nr:hypothetical protein [Dehalococcoidales bacterium]